MPPTLTPSPGQPAAPSYRLANALAKLAAAEEKPGLHIRRNGFPVASTDIRLSASASRIDPLSMGILSSSILTPPNLTLTIDGEIIDMDPMTVVTTSDGVIHVESVAGERFQISQWRFPDSP